jgi:hypothetical protein
MVRVKMFRASNGDCFLIRGSGANVLMDGGYAATFEEHLRPELAQVGLEGQRLDLLVATHIDQDHILGVIAFLEANGPAGHRAILEIDAIWFNSLRCLTAPVRTTLPPQAKKLVGALARQGFQPRPTVGAVRPISARQGSSLGAVIRRCGYTWNGGDGSACLTEDAGRTSLADHVFIRVLGPTEQRLAELHKFWLSALIRRGYPGPFGSNDDLDEAFEMTCNRAPALKISKATNISAGGNRSLDEVYVADKSVTNGSSISVLMTFDGVRMLFLADAWAEDSVEAMKKLRAEGESLTFDAIKISHHGSLQNTSPELLRLVDAPVYFVSSNGAVHEHPDIEVLKAIVDRPTTFTRTIHFNYETPASAELRVHRSVAGAGFVVVEHSTDWVEISAQR